MTVDPNVQHRDIFDCFLLSFWPLSTGQDNAFLPVKNGQLILTCKCTYVEFDSVRLLSVLDIHVPWQVCQLFYHCGHKKGGFLKRILVSVEGDWRWVWWDVIGFGWHNLWCFKTNWSHCTLRMTMIVYDKLMWLASLITSLMLFVSVFHKVDEETHRLSEVDLEIGRKRADLHGLTSDLESNHKEMVGALRDAESELTSLKQKVKVFTLFLSCWNGNLKDVNSDRVRQHSNFLPYR